MILFLHVLFIIFVFFGGFFCIKNYTSVTFDVITLYYLHRIHNIDKYLKIASLNIHK